jgi:hypothetical protein
MVMMEYPITPEWVASINKRMTDLNLSVYGLAKLVGTSGAAISHILTRGKNSALVPRIDAALASADRNHSPRRPPEIIAEIAALREGRDAIHEDILRLETVRATVEERLAEAYERRAQFDIAIRARDGGGLP